MPTAVICDFKAIFGSLLLTVLLASNTLAATQPNIVMIVVDDLGSGELQWYPSEADISARSADADTVFTPNLFELAKSGVRFVNYRSPAPVCSPARVGILTGQYPQQYGIRDYLPDNSGWELPPNTPTIASLLRDGAGYRTAHFGKWHLGDSRPSSMPTHFGFDEAFSREGNELLDGYMGTSFIVDDDIASAAPVDSNEHSSTTITNKAITFIESAENEDKPYYANVWYRAPHLPLDPPGNFPKVVPGYNPQTYSVWPRTWSEQVANIPELAALGDLQNHSATADAKRRAMLIASIAWLDYEIGRLIERIDELDPSGNTVIVFMSDNGAPNRSFAQGSGQQPGTWRPNADLSGVKKSTFEGGIYVPMFVRWPSSAINPGSSTEIMTVGYDFLPTFAELASIDISSESYIGRSFMSLISGGPSLPARPSPLIWESRSASANWKKTNPWAALDTEHNNYAVIYDANKRKLVSNLDTTSDSITRLLFDTNVTTTETKGIIETSSSSIIDTEPNTAAELESSYRNWRQQVGRIDAQLDPQLSSAEETNLCLDFAADNSVAVMIADRSYDFSGEDFSFQTRVTLDALPESNTMTIAEHADSWSLTLLPTPSANRVAINLTLNGRDPSSAGYPGEIGDQLIIQGETDCTVSCDLSIAFTVRGQSDHDSTVKLYANDLLIGEYKGNTGDSIYLGEVYANETSAPHLGNDPAGQTKITGLLIDPRFYRIQLTPSEIADISLTQSLEECSEGGCH